MDEITFHNVLQCAPTWPVQLTILCCGALVQFILIPGFAFKVMKPFFEKQSYYEQYKDLNQKLWLNGYGVDFDPDLAFIFACVFCAIILQHVFGGLLCVPATIAPLMGWEISTFSTVAILARWGAQFEAQWEFQDYIYRWYSLFFRGEEGKKENPPPLMVLFTIHHMMGLSMIVPMNIYYPDCYWYFVLVLQLQGAAAIGMGLQQFGFTLDVATPKGLKTMKICVAIVFVVMVGSRAIFYIPVIVELLMVFWSSSMKFFAGGCTVAVLMGLLNTLMCMDATGKFKKFCLSGEMSEEKMKNMNKKMKRRLSGEAFGGGAAIPNMSGEGGGAKMMKRMSGFQEPVEAREPLALNEPLIAA